MAEPAADKHRVYVIRDMATGLIWSAVTLRFESDPTRFRLYKTREHADDVAQALSTRPGCGGLGVEPYILTLEREKS